MKSHVADPGKPALCMRIVPVTGSTIYLTNYPIDLVMGGHTYLSASGFEFTGFSATADAAPASIDLEGIVGQAGITQAAISSGSLDGARYAVFATTWATPVEDDEPLTAGFFGAVEISDVKFHVSGLSLADALTQQIGQTYTAQCPKKFGGQEFAGCKINLAAITVTGTLTSVTSASVFYSSARTEAADTFGAGTIRFTSGANAGLPAIEVKSFAAGVITTIEPFYYLPAAGDAYSMVPGCRKTPAACQARSNILNFGGFPFVPTSSTYQQVGTGL